MNRVLDRLYDCHRFIISIEKVLLCVILFTMIFFSFGQVIARNVFSQGYIWIDVFLRHGVIWVAFLGASLATEYRQHIKIDVLSHFITDTANKKIVDIGICVFQVFICSILVAGSVEYVLMLKQYPTFIFKYFPVWGLRMIVPFSFFMMILSGLFHICTLLAGRELPSIDYETVDTIEAG